MDSKKKEEEMTDINDLKSIIMLTYLKDHMLEKIAKITNIKEEMNERSMIVLIFLDFS